MIGRGWFIGEAKEVRWRRGVCHVEKHKQGAERGLIEWSGRGRAEDSPEDIRRKGAMRTELLDELLILVEVLESVSILMVNPQRGGLLAVRGVSKDADAHLRARDVRQLDVASETLVLLRVVILEANLQLDGLEELTLLLLRAGEDLVDAFAELGGGHLGHGILCTQTGDDMVSGRGAACEQDLRGACAPPPSAEGREPGTTLSRGGVDDDGRARGSERRVGPKGHEWTLHRRGRAARRRRLTSAWKKLERRVGWIDPPGTGCLVLY